MKQPQKFFINFGKRVELEKEVFVTQSPSIRSQDIHIEVIESITLVEANAEIETLKHNMTILVDEACEQRDALAKEVDRLVTQHLDSMTNVKNEHRKELSKQIGIVAMAEAAADETQRHYTELYKERNDLAKELKKVQEDKNSNDRDYFLVQQKLSITIASLQKIEAYFCACSYDGEIVPRFEARETLKKLGNLKGDPK